MSSDNVRIKFTVNGETLMNGQLGDWKRTPPSAIQHMLKPGKAPQPYMQAALGALLEASMLGTDAHIEATTTPTGWCVRVTHLAAAG
jgi:hypothetical protein